MDAHLAHVHAPGRDHVASDSVEVARAHDFVAQCTFAGRVLEGCSLTSAEPDSPFAQLTTGFHRKSLDLLYDLQFPEKPMCRPPPPTRANRTIAIIPARGNSKGIPRKNLVDLGGKPLVAYSILAATAARSIDRVIVSTDDDEIAEVARAFGAETPFIRPSSIAGDSARVGDAIEHTLDQIEAEGDGFDAQVILYPTHPFRTPELVDMLVAKLSMGFARARTLKPVEPSELDLHVFEGDAPRALFPRSDPRRGRTYFRPLGLVEAYRRPDPEDRQRPATHYWDFNHEVTDPIAQIDIDVPSDLELARRIIEGCHFDFGDCAL